MDSRERIIVKKDLHSKLVSGEGGKKFKLIFNPSAYVVDAIKCLEYQLSNARSESKRKKLIGRINSWKGELEILNDLETKQKVNENDSAEKIKKPSKVKKATKGKESTNTTSDGNTEPPSEIGESSI